MKPAVYCLLISVFVAMCSEISAQCNFQSCTDTFTQTVAASPTMSTYCSSYNVFKSCVTNVCGSSLPSGTFDYVDKILKDNGISCNSGRNIQFSLSIILGCIYIAFSISR